MYGVCRGRVRRLRTVVSRDGQVIFFKKTNMSARDGVPSFQDTAKVCRRGCGCSPRRIIDRDFFVGCPRTFCRFCGRGVVVLSTGPGTTRLGLTRLRRTKGLRTIIARGVSKLRRTTKDEGICRLRKDVREGCYVGYKGFCSTRCIGGSRKVPEYDYNKVVGPSMMLCRRKLSRGAVRKTIRTVSSTSVLVVKNASLIICPTTNFVSCFRKGRLIIVGGSRATEDIQTRLTVSTPVKRILNTVRIDSRWGFFFYGCF